MLLINHDTHVTHTVLCITSSRIAAEYSPHIVHRSSHRTFCRCMFLVSCSSSMFCSFLFISRRFSSPGLTRSRSTELRPPLSPWWAAWDAAPPPSGRQEKRLKRANDSDLDKTRVRSESQCELRSFITYIDTYRGLARKFKALQY